MSTTKRQRVGPNKGSNVSAQQSSGDDTPDNVNNGIDQVCHSILEVKTYKFSPAASALRFRPSPRALRSNTHLIPPLTFESITFYSFRNMNSTDTDFNARRAQRDQGTRDLCNPDYIRLILATTQTIQNSSSGTDVAPHDSQTGGQNAGK
jgi:hypothetical protein